MTITPEEIEAVLKRLRLPIYSSAGEALDTDDMVNAIIHLRAELARVEAERDEARADYDKACVKVGSVMLAIDGASAIDEIPSLIASLKVERDAALSRAESARREAFEEVVAFCSVRDRGTPDAGSNAMRFIASHFGTMARALLDAPTDGKREGE